MPEMTPESVEELVALVARRSPVVLDRDALDAVLALAPTVRTVDAGLGGAIRVLDAAGTVVVQEQAPDGRLLLRRRHDRAAADEFVAGRLAIYERMWDG